MKHNLVSEVWKMYQCAFHLPSDFNMMTPLKFAFCLTCLFFGKTALKDNLTQATTVQQKRRFISADVGDTLTLKCHFDNDAAKYYWYKQTLGQKLQLISATYKFDSEGIFENEFKGNPRFTLEIGLGKNHLMITDLKISDSATYYCASGYSFMFEFGDGATVSVKGSGLNIPALIHQSASETIQPGGSLTLNCTVHTGTCDEEHSVYWFKDSGQSHPGLIYTNDARNSQCKKKPETQSHTCVYNLPMNNLTRSHVGTYYCAFVSSGHILFGNGTTLDFEEQVNSPVLVYFLSGAVAFTVLLSVLLAFLVCKINKTRCCQSSESQTRLKAPSTRNAEINRDAESLHYAALSVNLPNRSERHRDNTKTYCVYSSVK
ncbi:polymeric immunoglobulin receptor-like [Channa argus]|uniref:polymeric immunoglobulin receptor-like n=1 Tax=Channa argus TaxID=215402 RepID=UPI003521A205